MQSSSSHFDNYLVIDIATQLQYVTSHKKIKSERAAFNAIAAAAAACKLKGSVPSRSYINRELQRSCHKRARAEQVTTTAWFSNTATTSRRRQTQIPVLQKTVNKNSPKLELKRKNRKNNMQSMTRQTLRAMPQLGKQGVCVCGCAKCYPRQKFNCYICIYSLKQWAIYLRAAPGSRQPVKLRSQKHPPKSWWPFRRNCAPRRRWANWMSSHAIRTRRRSHSSPGRTKQIRTQAKLADPLDRSQHATATGSARVASPISSPAQICALVRS